MYNIDLEELGVPRELYSYNKRKDGKDDTFRLQHGFSDEELWNLDMNIIFFLYTRLKAFKDTCKDVFDMEYIDNIEWQGEEINLKQALDILTQELGDFINWCYADEEYNTDKFKDKTEWEVCQKVQNVIPLIGKILYFLWY